MSWDSMATRLSVLAVTISLFTGGMAYLDSRHASASDVRDLTRILKASEIARIEYQIEEAERRIRRIHRVPEEERPPFEADDLIDIRARREHLLRELDRLEME